MEEAFNQTGETPVRCDISRHGHPATGKATWIISFKKKVRTFCIFCVGSRARLMDNKPRITRHSPGCQGWCNPFKCTRTHRCETCGLTKEKHAGPVGPECENDEKCANCHGPHKASHDNCPARPTVKGGKIIKPTHDELVTIRKAARLTALAGKTKDSRPPGNPPASSTNSPVGGATLEPIQPELSQSPSPMPIETTSTYERGTKRPRGERVTAHENAGSTPTGSQTTLGAPSSSHPVRVAAKSQSYNLKSLSRASLTPGSSQGNPFAVLDTEDDTTTRPELEHESDEEMDYAPTH